MKPNTNLFMLQHIKNKFLLLPVNLLNHKAGGLKSQKNIHCLFYTHRLAEIAFVRECTHKAGSLLKALLWKVL